MTIKEAANMLGLSERQIKRLKKGVHTEGAAALVHKNRGRSPKHALSGGEHCQILELAISLYKDTSCQHMSELLAEHQSITASAKTIARVLHKANVKLCFGKKQARRRRSRDRMPQEGMLVQLDASLHSWLDNHRKFALHGAIDDATGKILALSFRPTEDQEGYFSVLEQMLNQYGTPMSFYSDRHTIFFSPKRNKLSIDEELAGAMAPQSQFGRALRELGILHIPASSAQAKGRIERLWGTLQSRLVVEMRSCPRKGYRRRERLPQKLHKAF
ncbi:MAG: ISNCY family transposase [Thermaerobacter sp.]|nr:ISNCY family transposase [Thermaerobacter sp.]